MKIIFLFFNHFIVDLLKLHQITMVFADTKLSKVDGYRLAQQILLTSVIITITTKCH